MHDYHPEGYDFVAGTDEAGYGAWAGTLVVAAVLAPADWVPPSGLTDSKQLTEAQREALFIALQRDTRIKYRIGSVDSQTIDRQGVFNVLRHQHEILHQGFAHEVEGRHRVLFIADGSLKLNHGIRSLPKADTFVPAVSAASIFAKVTRDRGMVAAGQVFPGYGFEKHKGYGVPLHEAALARLGPCEIHRKSYGPIQRFKKAEPVGDVFADFDDLPQE